MEILIYVLLLLWFCLAPLGVTWLCRRFKILDMIGPMIILYAVGIITGNLGIWPEEMGKLQEILSSAMVPLAIPMMLFGCTFKKEQMKTNMLSLVTGLFSVVLAVMLGYFLFGVHMEEGQKIGGMLTGVYTGGTINLAALKTMLGASDESYILINTYDILVCTAYLMFLMTIGIKIFRKILPFNSSACSDDNLKDISASSPKNPGNIYKKLLNKEGFIETMKETATSLGLTLLICAVAGGLALLVSEDSFMVVFILTLTTGGIACSFIKKIREMKYNYDIGMYFINIFCITVASMANFSELDLTGGMNLLGYLFVAVFGSLIIHTLLARLFKIDADTIVITSVAFINSPPFVPMFAAAMKNRDVLVAGLSIGIIGYALGNYLGYIIYRVLEVVSVTA